jgi:hypothetical protein
MEAEFQFSASFSTSYCPLSLIRDETSMKFSNMKSLIILSS